MNTHRHLKKVGTHHGRFHADEVMATAILKGLYEIDVTRTRDDSILSTLDIVYDVGGGEFDHHDAEKRYREDGIPFAACGLIWNSFGREAIKMKYPSLIEEDIESIFPYVDRVLIEGIDALDNGIRLCDEPLQVMNISSIIANFNPPWYCDKSEENAFNEAVELASKVLENTIDSKYSVIKSRNIVISAYENRSMPEVILLNQFCPWGETLRDIDEKDEVLYVVYPSKDTYAMQTVRGAGREDKKPMPKEWAGKRDKDLAAVTGVEDAVFCHTGRFIAVAKTFDGIMKLAQIAVKEPFERQEKKLMAFIRKLLSGR